MSIFEIEVKFPNIDPSAVRKGLIDLGAIRSHKERLMRRALFDVLNPERDETWLRVRDEGDKVTLAYKSRHQRSIDGTEEIQITVSDFDKTRELLRRAGLSEFAYQENRRESWRLDDAELEIDTWPWLDPLLEIEAVSTDAVKAVAQKLKLSWEEHATQPIDVIYQNQYGISQEQADQLLKHLKFDVRPPEVIANAHNRD